MHMADALVSPAVGGTMWVVSGGLLAYCANRVKTSARKDLVPMMGVLGAFVFAAQMINFSIPGTGSSGHLGGGLILTVLLGPYAAFLTIASVLTVQAFFFADGGLLALGCNIFNLGFFPAFVAYPLIYRVAVRSRHGASHAWGAAVLAAVVGLELGALGVVLETRASGISDLPLGAFLLLMLPIHLAIGVVEGLVTAAVIAFVAKARPEALPTAPVIGDRGGPRTVLTALAVVAILIGGLASWFASTHPDGLEWSIAKVTGKETVADRGDGLHQRLAGIQTKTALLPDYGFRTSGSESSRGETEEAPAAQAWPAVSAGTSLSGIVGAATTLTLAALIGLALRLISRCRCKE
ncbi:MAG: energy-coupling factor ABC transporter permease [Kiritimatiellae bacterium]|nr:energy-coupling factor ABC transporter permease [Kiritimatiellia bacterium]